MMSRVQRLLQHWKYQGIKCPPGATLKTLADFESRNGVILPADMREYFLMVNGTGPALEVYDDDFFSFYRIEDVISLVEWHPECPKSVAVASEYFVFADHSINCPTFAIRLHGNPQDPNPVVTLYTDGRKFELSHACDSFGAFIDGYLTDATKASVGDIE